jgi:hypothetical protein
MSATSEGQARSPRRKAVTATLGVGCLGPQLGSTQDDPRTWGEEGWTIGTATLGHLWRGPKRLTRNLGWGQMLVSYTYASALSQPIPNKSTVGFHS